MIERQTRIYHIYIMERTIIVIYLPVVLDAPKAHYEDYTRLYLRNLQVLILAAVLDILACMRS